MHTQSPIRTAGVRVSLTCLGLLLALPPPALAVQHVGAGDPAVGGVQREASQSAYVRSGEIDLATSAVNTVVTGDVVTIDARFRTTDGRFLGPDQGGAIAIAGDGIDIERIQDNQDGSYRITLVGDPDAEISVSLLEHEIFSGPASEFGPREPQEELPGWLLWPISLAVLLILVWLLKKVFP